MSNEAATPDEAPRLEGTKLQIVEAALETLKTKGYAGASAREIARAGDFNQALIFYHFGSVEKLLLAVVDETSARRMAVYRPAIEAAQTLPEFVQVARDIYAEDVEKGYITVLVEVVSGSASSPELAREVVARMEPWIDLAEQKVRDLLAGTPFEAFAEPRDIAFGLIAFYLGIDMMTHLDGDRTRAQALLDLGARLSTIVAGFLPQPKPQNPA
jgi:AcrR family transcriptional regulator